MNFYKILKIGVVFNRVIHYSGLSCVQSSYQLISSVGPKLKMRLFKQLCNKLFVPVFFTKLTLECLNLEKDQDDLCKMMFDIHTNNAQEPCRTSDVSCVLKLNYCR